MERYDVYLYNIPKLSSDKQAIPVPDSVTKEFDDLDAAKSYAEDARKRADRVVVIKTTDGVQKLVERYIDGKYDAPKEASPAS